MGTNQAFGRDDNGKILQRSQTHDLKGPSDTEAQDMEDGDG